MHIKRIHEMMEELTAYAECEVKKAIENECYDVNVIGGIVDMIKDLADAEKNARIAKAMQKGEEEEEAEEKYILKEFMDKLGEDDGRRFYDRWRYKSGRFAPKGRGTRRGYTPYLHMMDDMYEDDEPYWPEMMNYRMGYSSGRGGNSGSGGRGGSYGMNRGGQGGNSGRSGYDGDDYDGGYGYSDGRQGGSGRDGRSGGSRYGQSYDRYSDARRHYHDEKDMESMKKMEESFGDILEDFGEIADDTWKDLSPEQKNKQKPKINQMIQKLQKLQQM